MSRPLPWAFSALAAGILTVPKGSSTESPLTVAGRKFIGGEPMNPATNRLHGVFVELPRGGELLEDPALEHRDPVAQRHRLGLVVGDVDRGDAEPLLQPRDLGPHLATQLGVEVGQRLVEEERLGVPDDRPAHRDSLPLTTGQVAGLALEVLVELQRLGRVAHLLVDSRSPAPRPAATGTRCSRRP